MNGKDDTIEDIWAGIPVDDVTTKAIKDSFIYLNKTRADLPCKEIHDKVETLQIDVTKIKNNSRWISGITGAAGAGFLLVVQWALNKIRFK